MLGIDLVNIPEFTQRLAAGGDAFLKKAFRPEERQNHTPEHLAGLWAAKEAIIKAGALEGGSWLMIRISHEPSGKPHAFVGTQEYDISIAHHGDYAVAVAQGTKS